MEHGPHEFGPRTADETGRLRVEVEHRSFEESCRRAEELGGVDLAFFSPPYPTEVPGAKGREGAPTRDYGGDAPKHFLWEDYQRLGDCVYRALKPGGFCIIIIDGPVRIRDKRKGSERSLIAFKLAVDWAERVGFRYVEHEAYVRNSAPGDFFPRRRSGWEPMHVFQRPGARGYFDSWAYSQPSETAGVQWSNGHGARKWCGEVYQGKAGIDKWKRPDRRTMTTAITASDGGPNAGGPHVHDREHPAPFTAHIAKVQVVSYSPPGGLVLDPFVGSGTTAISAAKHGRSFVGGDLGARERDGARWADVARERAEIAAREWAEKYKAAAAVKEE